MSDELVGQCQVNDQEDFTFNNDSLSLNINYITDQMHSQTGDCDVFIFAHRKLFFVV